MKQTIKRRKITAKGGDKEMKISVAVEVGSYPFFFKRDRGNLHRMEGSMSGSAFEREEDRRFSIEKRVCCSPKGV